MTWPTRRVFVTGASGFIGRHVVDALVERQALVTTLALHLGEPDPRVTRISGRIEDLYGLTRILGEREIDTVLHLAAQVKPAEPAVFWESNVRGTWSLLEACRAVPSVQRLVVVSTIRALEPARRDAYAVSKRCADAIADCYDESEYGVPLRVVALPPIYGSDGQFSQPVVGDPDHWMHVCDAVAMILRAADAIPER